MPSIHDLKQSKFLTKGDVEPAILVTIKGYDQLNVAKEGVEPDLKWALYFDETEKPMVLNSTNGQIIAHITKSEDFDFWIGHKIVLYNDPNISFGGKLTGGIRARAPRNQNQGMPMNGQMQQQGSPMQPMMNNNHHAPQPMQHMQPQQQQAYGNLSDADLPF